MQFSANSVRIKHSDTNYKGVFHHDLYVYPQGRLFPEDDVGTCSKQTNIVLNDDHTIQAVRVEGGCNGNLQGISRLVVGMDAQEAIRRMRGIQCGFKPTSCPDQLATALEQALQQG